MEITLPPITPAAHRSGVPPTGWPASGPGRYAAPPAARAATAAWRTRGRTGRHRPARTRTASGRRRATARCVRSPRAGWPGGFPLRPAPCCGAGPRPGAGSRRRCLARSVPAAGRCRHARHPGRWSISGPGSP
ncbi:hypothetical protein G6F46_014486 [Rhizopus delemar]|nr:hypothetical protein G6F46_014486 [Rhizopus delemar]